MRDNKNEADLCIFNNALSPAQLNNLSNELECEVLDRTGLILNIFTERAKTKKLNCELTMHILNICCQD